MHPIRTAAKAIIIRQAQLLVVLKHDHDGVYAILPGGGQHPGETLEQTLQRECYEELGTTVTIGALWFVREYIGKNHEFAALEPEHHAIELMFACQVPDAYAAQGGPLPDDGQVGIAWVPLAELAAYRLYPRSLRTKLQPTGRGPEQTPVYLGDVN